MLHVIYGRLCLHRHLVQWCTEFSESDLLFRASSDCGLVEVLTVTEAKCNTPQTI